MITYNQLLHKYYPIFKEKELPLESLKVFLFELCNEEEVDLYMELDNEVKESILQYENYRKQAQQFNLKMLNEAKLILDAKKYSYKRGNSSLLETLDAQRTYNDIQTNYLETLFNCASANIILNKVIGN